MSRNGGDATAASISARTEEHETSANNTDATNTDSGIKRRSPASSISQPALPTLRKQMSTGRLPTQTGSATASPRTSRNTSPLRKDGRTTALAGAQTPSQPSAAAIQRALSASNVPQLVNAAADGTVRLPRPQRNAASTVGETSRHLTTTPRLKSPPPNSARRVSATPESTKKVDTPPSIVVQSSGPSTPVQSVQSPRSVSGDSKSELQTPAKASSRGPSGKSVLATVDENSDAIEQGSTQHTDLRPLTKLSDEDKLDNDRPFKAVESGSESGGNKSDGLNIRRPSQSQPPKRSKNSYTSLAKARPPEGTGNMTVETETVPSIPHSGIGTGERNSGNREGSGTVRMKSSTETIRPKKERRPPSKKARSINQGNGSSRADIFEARIANAVEANSSDSDETFVYESNPPEPRRPRHHSRTPSVTSAHSVADGNRGLRSFGEAMDERRVAGKRSMKFINNPFHSSDSPSDRHDGSHRSHQARHYGRWGRGGSHASMFEPDSPFTQASKLRSNNNSLRHSRPDSPRSPQTAQRNGLTQPDFGNKKGSAFDFDPEGADDERTPLLTGTVRNPRILRNLAGENSSSASIDEYYGVRRSSRCGRMSGCLLGVLIFALVIVSTIGFLVMSNRPLSEIAVRRIENVLASEQEIILDLRVGAVNPNALSISIMDMDVDVFAKSRYITDPHKPAMSQGLRAIRRARARETGQNKQSSEEVTAPKKGKDDDDYTDAVLLGLGSIFHFNKALEFAGSPIKRQMQYSIGEVRLGHPGNKTVPNVVAQWEKVLHHPFELIVRGTLKYKLPVSARDESVLISANIIVHPEDGIDSLGRMRTEPVDHSNHWQWIDWDREQDMHDHIGDREVKAYE